MAENENNLPVEPAACFDKIKTRGRPKLVLNSTGVAVIESLAAVMCTHDEVAACLGVTKDTLYAKHNNLAFSTAYEKGTLQGKMSLRRSQFQLAKANATMAIFLGKQYLDQVDVVKPPADDGKEALDRLCDAIRSAGGGKDG